MFCFSSPCPRPADIRPLVVFTYDTLRPQVGWAWSHKTHLHDNKMQVLTQRSLSCWTMKILKCNTSPFYYPTYLLNYPSWITQLCVPLCSRQKFAVFNDPKRCRQMTLTNTTYTHRPILHTHTKEQACINMADGKASWGRLALTSSLPFLSRSNTQPTDTHTYLQHTHIQDQKHRMKHGLLQAWDVPPWLHF